MIVDEKRLAEIVKTKGLAALGYGVCDNRIYAKDVGDLLDERAELIKDLDFYRGIGASAPQFEQADGTCEKCGLRIVIPVLPGPREARTVTLTCTRCQAPVHVTIPAVAAVK